ncbi:LysR family hydrogen peroxide-inducible transcriptional activator [Rhizomicrobium palustre]|uniref:LysR family hydrogen peroxide-inducible transcriptional activator n=1 Tax=Rhizomicrobium palustre TaxID=189966 RepID=A0A846N1U4_9PROT|nr:LysR substrate-binding domain-containing protein [Rhizomicrobium palustre]NIK89117.1 LysR family hydrogen peroxide-inducible transcriptional activator [Rhizomicrobium palustre]
MNLQDLRYLVALADCGHFGRAADSCHITQPTLSAQLKKLEAYLGVILFERTSRSLTVTSQGAPILAKAREVVAAADALLELARREGGVMSGPLQLGVIPTLGPYLLPTLLPLIAERFPKARLVLQEDLTGNLLAALKAHRLDGALLALPLADDDLACEALFDEPFYFACAKSHGLAKTKTIDPAELADEKLLLLADGHCLREQTLAVCGQIGARSDAADFRATSLETIRQMVAAGLGATLLPALALSKDGLCIRPLKGPPYRRIGLVWRKSFPRQDDMQLLAKTIKAHLPEGVRGV